MTLKTFKMSFSFYFLDEEGIEDLRAQYAELDVDAFSALEYVFPEIPAGKGYVQPIRAEQCQS